MTKTYGYWKYGYYSYSNNGLVDTNWDRFSARTTQVPTPGCGYTHSPFNTTTHYQYDNNQNVENSCEDWTNYPYLLGQTQTFNCLRWGCNETGYQTWWLQHLPKYSGLAPDGKWNNWWRYIVDHSVASASPLPFTTQDLQVLLGEYLKYPGPQYMPADGKTNILDVAGVMAAITNR